MMGAKWGKIGKPKPLTPEQKQQSIIDLKFKSTKILLIGSMLSVLTSIIFNNIGLGILGLIIFLGTDTKYLKAVVLQDKPEVNIQSKTEVDNKPIIDIKEVK